MSIAVDGGAGVHESGERAVAGSLTCLGCGYSLTLSATDRLPRCPTCGGEIFRRHRLFEQPTMDADAVEVAESAPAWLAELREEHRGAGFCVAYELDGVARLTVLEHGWTRIGRSGTADIRLDDPTVSRRHALLVRTPEGDLRAMDDRSLNGLFVNGEKTDWIELADGDELEIGRYRLYVLEA